MLSFVDLYVVIMFNVEIIYFFKRHFSMIFINKRIIDLKQDAHVKWLTDF